MNVLYVQLVFYLIKNLLKYLLALNIEVYEQAHAQLLFFMVKHL